MVRRRTILSDLSSGNSSIRRAAHISLNEGASEQSDDAVQARRAHMYRWLTLIVETSYLYNGYTDRKYDGRKAAILYGHKQYGVTVRLRHRPTMRATTVGYIYIYIYIFIDYFWAGGREAYMTDFVAASCQTRRGRLDQWAWLAYALGFAWRVF